MIRQSPTLSMPSDLNKFLDQIECRNSPIIKKES